MHNSGAFLANLEKEKMFEFICARDDQKAPISKAKRATLTRNLLGAVIKIHRWISRG